MAGYSGTPLTKKLNFKDGQSRLVIGLPETLTEAITGDGAAWWATSDDIPEGFNQFGRLDYIHYFVKDAATLLEKLPDLKQLLDPDGMIWISWPKKAAVKLGGPKSDITEDVIRRRALEIGLVDIKVCAVDEIWSGLKLVVPLALRPRRT
ncbi:MAG: DUF3052 domain-containing protein [Pseudomonadota bacterium]